MFPLRSTRRAPYGHPRAPRPSPYRDRAAPAARAHVPRGGKLALRGFDRGVRAKDVDLGRLARLVERARLRAALLSHIDVALLDGDAVVGVDDAEVVRGDAEKDGVFRAEDALLRV